MKAKLLTLVFLCSLGMLTAQNSPAVIHETTLPTGEVIEVLSDGTWKKKVIVKPAIDWVQIPAGSFKMGSPVTETDRTDDEQQVQVSLNGYKMSKHEVTFAQYDLFCEATGREKPDDNGWGRGNRPVINITWHDAAAFAAWMGGRLPTEAEWEYACRAGSHTTYNIGDVITTNQANFNGTKPNNGAESGEYRRQTMVVGSFAPNAWGLYDMHGNVWEWCSDWYGPYASTPQTNPQGPSKGAGKVFRGGGWYSGATVLRSARRYNLNPDFAYSFVGFRIVM
jgi:formylglycine-generating enzyme